MTNKLKISNKRGYTIDNSVTVIKEKPKIFLVNAEGKR